MCSYGCCRARGFDEKDEFTVIGATGLATLLVDTIRPCHPTDIFNKSATVPVDAASHRRGEQLELEPKDSEVTTQIGAGPFDGALSTFTCASSMGRQHSHKMSVNSVEVQDYIEHRVTQANQAWLVQEKELLRMRRESELRDMMMHTATMAKAQSKAFGEAQAASRYGGTAQLPPFDRTQHVPTLGLINPRSGAASGMDVLSAARDTPYYQDTFFNIIDVVKNKQPGGLLDVFRLALNIAKDDAKSMGLRPRIVSGGGDGTASFTLFILFSALKADDSRPEEYMQDTGNGFIWTDEELRLYFPAIAQMPLGSANDFANTLGWGQKYPGDPAGNCFKTRRDALRELQSWISTVIDPDSRVVNFDLFGIMPPAGADEVDFKICELTGQRGMNPAIKSRSGEKNLTMKVAATQVPFFVCLYFSAGFAAYMVARFQLNRRSHPMWNRLEYVRQAVGILSESTPPQMEQRLDKVCITCDGEQYFPPQDGNRCENSGQNYREVGFFNINRMANLMHAADRAPACARLTSVREPAKFNDGHLDMTRMKFRSVAKNPGPCFQTDKKKDMNLSFDGGAGKGVFFQWDGEARFAFSPSGKAFNILIRKVLNTPVVLGPFYNEKVGGDPDNGEDVAFAFCGDDHKAQEAVRSRILRCVDGQLEAEMNATQAELNEVGLSGQ